MQDNVVDIFMEYIPGGSLALALKQLVPTSSLSTYLLVCVSLEQGSGTYGSQAGYGSFDDYIWLSGSHRKI